MNKTWSAPWVALLAALLLALAAAPAQAARNINGVTLNGGASVTVAPGATITAVVNVTTTGSGTADNWRCTGSRIATTPPGALTVNDHEPDYTSAGTYSQTYSITAPGAAGTYNAYFVAYDNDGCSTGASGTFTMAGAVIVNAPPAVSSINRASADPANAGSSVSWTVTFSETVTGVDAGDFALVQGGSVSGASLTGVSGGGTTWTVTANTGSGAGTLGLNLADNDSIIDAGGTPLGGAGAGNGNFTGQIYTIVVPFSCTPPAGAPAGLTCVCDTYDRAALNPSTIFGSNYVLSSSDTTGILPSIVANRLRLTNNTGNNAKSVSLPAIFPAAGNYFSVDFKHYAYDGSGADGIAVTLSDYAVPAVTGAYGGSLGYAQRCGVNGFAGGWLGVGIDEYGNFRNDEECRGDGGSPTGRVLDSVAVRGSGAALAGYLLHAESGGLAPGVDQSGAAPGPGHSYRVIVDHSNGVNAWTSVLRDTGSGYATIVAPYDAKAMPGQAAVPSNWQISLTGSTGGSTNYHEIDDLRICATYVWPPSGGTASGFSAIDEAYGNASGSPKPATMSYLTGHVYMKMMGLPFRLNVAALTAANQIQTAYVVSGSKYLQVKLVDNSDGGCVLDSSQVNYCNAACIAKSAVAGGSQVLTYTSGDAGQKRTGDYTLNTAWKNLAVVMRECTTAACSAFTATPAACSTDAFSVRPAGISSAVSNETPPGAGNAATNGATSGNPKFKAGGDPFALTATIAGIAGNPNGYTGVPKVDNNGLQTVAPATTLGSVAGTFPAATSGTPDAAATGTGFTYSEVGAFRFRGYNPASDTASNRGVFDGVMSATECAALTAAQCDALRAASWTGVDSISSKNDCIANSYANVRDTSGTYATNANYGKLGCNFGLTADSAAMGRFYPHHFDTEIPEHACSNAFTYSGQPFKLKATAKNAGGQTTVNYAGALAKAGTYADGNGAAGSFTPATLPAATYAAGVADLTDFDAPPPLVPEPDRVRFAYTSKLTAPTTLKLRLTDADGASSAGYTEGTTPLRSGRLRLSSVYGYSSPLQMPVEAQYWSGASWVKNAADNCTALAGANLLLTPVGWAVTAPGTLVNGAGNITLTPTGPGSVTLCADLGPDPVGGAACVATGAGRAWLQSKWPPGANYDNDPSAMATFGVFSPEGRKGIYNRELY